MATPVTLEAGGPPAAPAATTDARPRAGQRLLFVDNLRVFLTILVVMLHLAITYGAEGSWYYRERPVDEVAGLLLTFWILYSQWFFMGLFFFIAGYFVPQALDRKGTWAFMRDRLIRLGIPLVLFTLFGSPIVEYIKAVREYGWQGSLVDHALGRFARLDFAPGPLWFVETLLVFCLIYALGRGALRLLKAGESRPSQSGMALSHRLMVAFALAVALASFVVRLAIPIGEEWQHLQLAFYPQYSLMFAAGIVASRQGWLPELPARLGRTWTAIALATVAAMPVIFIAGGAATDLAPLLGGLTWQSLVLSVWEGFYCLGVSVALLGLFRRRFDRQGGVAKLMSANAYAVYIIHPLVIIPLAMVLSPLVLYPVLKWLLAVPLGVGLCFLVSEYVVRRLPLAKKVL